MVFHPSPGGAPKYIICNADEGEPGHHQGPLPDGGRPPQGPGRDGLAGYAVGASQGFIYCRGEYLSVPVPAGAGHQAGPGPGLPGREALLGTDFSFDVEVRSGAGSYVCGEETALIESIEGKRGYPRLKPPYPRRRRRSGAGPPWSTTWRPWPASRPSSIGAGTGITWGPRTPRGPRFTRSSARLRPPRLWRPRWACTLRELIDRPTAAA